MELECERCNWQWETRTEKKPKTCPSCNSPFYEKPLTAYWANVRKANIKKKALASGRTCN